MDFRPTLIIGVGGTGCAVAQDVYANAKNEGLIDQGQLAVIGFDTDDNDVRALRTLGDRQKVRFSTASRIYHILEENPEFQESWFLDPSALTQDLLNMTLIDGAGQVRILTRLALHAACKRNAVVSDLRRVITDLAAVNNRDQFDGALNIFLIGSLAGATGCGSFIQIALAVRQIARESGVEHPQVRGLFLLPDIFVRAAGLPKDQEANVLVNSYAAVRELNAITLATLGRIPLGEINFEYLPGRFLREGEVPFEAVTFIDYENAKGQSLGRNIDHYKSMAARAAYTLLFTPIGQRFDSITVNAVMTRLGAAAVGNTNCYSSISVLSAEYPQEAVLDYLTNRFALETVEGDWLQLDRMYQRRVQLFQERRALGDLSAQLPPQDEAYIADLDQMARERRPFFLEIRREIFREVEHDAGDVTTEEQHVKMLDAFAHHVRGSFADHNARIREAIGNSPMSSANLDDRTTIAEDVRQRERTLDRMWSVLENGARDYPDEIYDAVIAAADTMSPDEWRDHHLQTYLIKPSPHPVQARYFLYLLKREIKARMAQLHVNERRKNVLSAASGAGFGGGQTSGQDGQRGSRAILEKAEAIVDSGLFSRMINKDLTAFRKKYLNYYNSSLDLIRRYADTAVLFRAYERLLDDVSQLCQIIELVFGELEEVRDRLAREIDEMAEDHDRDRGATQGSLYVYADKAAKEELWEDIYQASSSIRQSKDVNASLIGAMYQELGERRMARHGGRRREAFSVQELFRKSVIEGYCRQTLEGDLSDRFDLNIVDAIRREASLMGVDLQGHFESIVKLIASQSEPFIGLVRADCGDLLMFWAMSPVVKDAIGEDRFFDNLFSFQQGESAIVREAFPTKAIYCVNTRLNLTLQDMAKFHPGDPKSDNINAPSTGRYDRAYRHRIEQLLSWAAERPGAIQPYLTPHLDRSWHKPGQLPEIFGHLDEGHEKSFWQAFALALGVGWLDRTRLDQHREVCDFLDPTKIADGLNRMRLANSHDIIEIMKRAQDHPSFQRSVLEGWSGIKRNKENAAGRKADSFEDLKLVGQLMHKDLFTDLLSIARNRNRASADTQMASAIRGHCELMKTLLKEQCTELDRTGQRRHFEDAYDRLLHKTVNSLRSDQSIPKETLKIMTEVPRNIIETVADQWSATS